jgi:hypothetical protein
VEDDPGWSILLDVHRVPEKGLPWLGQFVGVDIDYDQDVRQQVRSHDRWGRGTPLSMIGPAERYVPVGSEFFFSERNPTPWHIVVIQVDSAGIAQIYEDLFELFDTYHKVRTEYSSYQTLYGESRGDWTQFEQTLLRNKPAGIQVTFLTTDTILYMAIWIIYPTYQPVWNDYASYDALLNQPFPDITVDVPPYRQLISTKYYRSIYNQFNTYQILSETYVQY